MLLLANLTGDQSIEKQGGYMDNDMGDGLMALFGLGYGSGDSPVLRVLQGAFSFGEVCFQVAAGIAKFALAHAANFVGCRPATLLASAIASRESEPRYVCASK